MGRFNSLFEFMTGAIFNVIFIIVAVVAIIFVGTWAYSFGIGLFYNDTSMPLQEFTVEVTAGTSDPNRANALEVGRVLQDKGIVRSAWIFYLESRLNGTHNQLRPGTYVFNTHMRNNEIMQMMQHAEFVAAPDITITIREGLTIREIGELTAEMGLWTFEEWMYAVDNYGAQFFFLQPVQNIPGRANPLEGYLFPDTYRIPHNATPNDLIDRMLNQFQRVFTFEMEERAEELGMTIDEIITIASIIEMETRLASERPLVSAIVFNRLNRHPTQNFTGTMQLEMCSTVIYALALMGYETPADGHVLNRHIESTASSPYNTYRNGGGLPPGPITNPGRAAINAALNPANTRYLFMVLADPASGRHVFNTTFTGHNQAIERYRR
ncbi:MAG: endolytic transglycosylase MltG [Defluviitaleaceae bacterium]|nr:endolytic transglycosylase MltG [Defluviitaleaceae bacterium]